LDLRVAYKIILREKKRSDKIGLAGMKAVVAALIGYFWQCEYFAYCREILRCGCEKTRSGNAGMTNTLRTLGKFPAFLVILGDTLKGILACVIGFIFLKLVSIRQN